MILLELFCGTKSIGKVFQKHGTEVFSIDFDKQHNPDLCINILDFNIDMLPEKFRHPDVIWASPPCTCFSVASIGHHWQGGAKAYIPKSKEAIISKEIVNKTVAIINELKPKYWYIENPRGVLRKLNLIGGIRKTVTYCQYGDTRMKPTDIWTNNILFNPLPPCKNNSPCHEPAPRGSRTGTQGVSGKINRAIIPELLCEDIYKYSVNIALDKQ